jgi:hypothetical protein
MTDLDRLAGRCSPVTLSNEKALSRIRACTHQHPAGSGGLGTAHGRRTADCRSRSQTGVAGSHYHDPRPAPLVHSDLRRGDDGLSRHP